MRPLVFILVLISSICSGCDRGFHLDKSDDLGTSSQGTVVAETWFTGAPLERPVWKICLRQNDSTNSVVLFTVESVFQESQPGYPHLVMTNGIEVVQDPAQSYIYSLTSRQFITNVWSGAAYAADYRQRQ
jgi:hypothetical protein